jgi:hypothetical protein
MKLIDVTAPNPVNTGEAFTLTIQHTPDSEGKIVSIVASPSGSFRITPSGAVLGAGGSTSVKCTVLRREPSPRACLLRVTLEESERFASPEVV